jgi:hypothetical protein
MARYFKSAKSSSRRKAEATAWRMLLSRAKKTVGRMTVVEAKRSYAPLCILARHRGSFPLRHHISDKTNKGEPRLHFPAPPQRATFNKYCFVERLLS